jgi:hypothetical protein
MKRYCIPAVVGTGHFPDSYRAAVADVPGVNTSAVIPTAANGAVTGTLYGTEE